MNYTFFKYSHTSSSSFEVLKSPHVPLSFLYHIETDPHTYNTFFFQDAENLRN